MDTVEHSMRIMQPHLGDEHVTWDPSDPESVKKAEEKFKDYVVAGHHQAFRVENVPARSGEPIREFDPQVKELLLVAPFVGG